MTPERLEAMRNHPRDLWFGFPGMSKDGNWTWETVLGELEDAAEKLGESTSADAVRIALSIVYAASERLPRQLVVALDDVIGAGEIVPFGDRPVHR